MQRVVELPSRGRLLVATDLQGNLADFERVEQLFETAAAKPAGATLVIVGDLVHGPDIATEDWPSYLGSFFLDDSVTLLARAQELQCRHPGRVHFLLGNHEHAHLGGPVVGKFFNDEAKRLEALLGAERSIEVRRWFSEWPLVALARRARLLMMHAAPAAAVRSAAQLDTLPYQPPSGQVGEVHPLLGKLLWARSASPDQARAFLDAFDPQLRVTVYGHDVARDGYCVEHQTMLCVSTSFGCFDGDKLYLDWDLARPVNNALQLARDGLRPLYPDAAPIHRVEMHSSIPPERHDEAGTDAASNDA